MRTKDSSVNNKAFTLYFTPMLAPNYTYKAKITAITDADSFTALVDCGFHINKTIKIRLFGIDAPEIRGIEREEGLKAKDYVASLILNKEVIIKTYKDPKDKYGRWLAEIIGDFGEGNPKNLTSFLLSKGIGHPYFGD